VFDKSSVVRGVDKRQGYNGADETSSSTAEEDSAAKVLDMLSKSRSVPVHKIKSSSGGGD
jgi:hypothetical protein